MTDFKLTKFRFNAVNPEVVHTTTDRRNLDPDSSYLNIRIEFQTSENKLKEYEGKNYCTVTDNVVKYVEDVYHNHVTSNVYSLVENLHDTPELEYIMPKIIETLHIWRRH